MGTDIHVQIEMKPKDAEEWINVLGELPDVTTDYKFRPDAMTNRKYNLFAYLAGVRNGTGFAGVSTHEPIQPKFPKRGLPDDVTERTKQKVFGHNRTYATFEELNNCEPENVELRKTGLVTAKNYLEWKHGDSPSSWSGGTTAPVVSHDKMEELIESGEVDLDKSLGADYYTRVNWKTTLKDTISYDQYQSWFSPYWMVSHDERDNVQGRVIFWFDS